MTPPALPVSGERRAYGNRRKEPERSLSADKRGPENERARMRERAGVRVPARPVDVENGETEARPEKRAEHHRVGRGGSPGSVVRRPPAHA